MKDANTMELTPNALTLPRNRKLMERAHAYALKSRADNTLDAYRSAWNDFETFCADHQSEALPAAPETICAYLALLAQAQKIATIHVKLAAIRYAHRTKGLLDPTHDDRVRLVLEGIKRTLLTRPTPKSAVLREELVALLAGLLDDLRGRRDRALLLLGFAGALRRSELVALQIEDVQFAHRKMTVLIRRSKTDQSGSGTVLTIPQIADVNLCPVRALRNWLHFAGLRTGPVFRAIDRWGNVADTALTDQVVALILKNAATRAGLDAKVFAGHSLRRGLATQAAREQVPAYDIRKVTRHKSNAMLDRYLTDDANAQQRTIRRALGDVEET